MSWPETPVNLAAVTDDAWWDRALFDSGDVHGHVRHDEAGHAAYLYESDDELLDRLEAYVVDGWAHGQRTVVFAEPERVIALRSRLAARDIAEALDAHDATTALTVFVRDGMPQASLFTTLINEAIAQAGHGSLRLYGEMVAILWRDGGDAAALELERLWNGYLAAHPMPLLCAYPAGLVADHPELGRLCRSHTHVIPAA
jgi:hypothetical protein